MKLQRAALLAMTLVGCGSGSEGSSPPEPGATTTGAGVTGAIPPDMGMPVDGSSSTSSTTAVGTTTSTTGAGGTGQVSASNTGTSTGGAPLSSTATSNTTSSAEGSMTATTDSGGSTSASSSSGNAGSGQGGSGQDGSGGGAPEGQCAVMPLTAEFRQSYDNLDPFYQKYADANGLPIISSMSPADSALTRACELVIDMTSARPDVLAALIENHIRFAIIAEDELTNDIPEYAYLDDSINERARGLGGTPAASCAEESILCNTTLDRWRGEGICVHEFAHTIASAGLFPADPTFQGRLEAAFDNAQSTGLFANTYAMENYQEYWAEGVQDWYFTNLESDPPNGIHNFVDRREELEAYDPALYGLIAEFLPDEPKFVDCYSDE